MSRRGKPVPKPRRDFKAWLLYTMQQQGARLPPNPTYKEIYATLSVRGLKPVNGDRP